MELPLLDRMQQLDAEHFPLVAASEQSGSGAFCGASSLTRTLPTPGPGEQYRFHFDMTKCIGCKCCVVACNEQNGNPADILFRRVGELEGGTYPNTHRHYLSIGCNHCLEPTCMTGCPVNAYSKDVVTGIVQHSASACIGCQYCTWNCSYGVPQFNPERGVVGKCDMCYGRLTQGQSPACVSACPEDAIEIELVRVDEWRREYQTLANSPGMPSADDSISTTRITRPVNSPDNLQKVNLGHLHAEHPHWPLVIMTVLTQCSVGAFTAIWFLQISGAGMHRSAAMIALMIGIVALTASMFHLGRPLHAARAMKMWRRSWLSREVLLFTLFSGAAAVYSLTLLRANPHSAIPGAATVLLGLAGVGASARLYLVPGRPAWNSPVTLLEFSATAALLAFAVANIVNSGSSTAGLLIAAGISLVIGAVRMARLAFSLRYELYASWQLLSTVLANKVLSRFSLHLAGMAITAFSASPTARLIALLAFISAELMGRYLFFVSVVPTSIASGYLVKEAA